MIKSRLFDKLVSIILSKKYAKAGKYLSSIVDWVVPLLPLSYSCEDQVVLVVNDCSVPTLICLLLTPLEKIT